MNRRIISAFLLLILLASTGACLRYDADAVKEDRKKRNLLLISLGLPFLPGPLIQYDTLNPGSPQRGKLLTAQRIWDLPYSYVVQLVNQYVALSGISLSSYPSLAPQYGMKYYRITYETVDASGTGQITASGVVWVPNAAGPFPLVAYCHGTEVGPNIEFSRISAGLFAMRGYVSVGPDYLGYGASAQIDHPFVHANSLALSTVDAIRASMQFVQYSGINLQYVDAGNTKPKLFVTGVSEGGMAAMATVKELETNFLATLPITASAPVSGPYDLSGTAANYIVSGKTLDTGQAEYLLFVIPIYKKLYPAAMTNPLSYYLKSPFDTLFANDLYPRSDYASIVNMLPSNTNDLLGDTFISNFIAGEVDLKARLADNDTYKFAPVAPLTVYAANQDVDVPKTNAETAYTWFQNHGAALNTYAVYVDGTHTSSVVPILANIMIWFDNPASPPPAP